MRIRKADKKDFEKIAYLMNKEYSKSPYNELWKEENAIKTLKYFSKVGDIFIMVDKQIRGFIISRDEYYNEGEGTIIEEIVVDSDFQGEGFGRRLIEYVEKRSRKKGIKSILLMTSKDAPAFKFYKKMGYTPSKKTVLFRKKL